MTSPAKKEIFEILNDFFDNIYVISLKRSENRHTLLNDSFSGLNFNYYWGVDGSEHTMQDFIEKRLYNSHLAKYLRVLNNRPEEDMLKNAVACALSHLGVSRDMLKNGYEKVLVLEDDIILGEHSKSDNLRNGLNELPDDWELFYLGHLNNNLKPHFSTHIRRRISYPLLHTIGYIRYNPEYFMNKYPKEFSGALLRPGYHYGAHAYALSPHGAEKIIRYQSPVTQEIDIAMAEMCRFRFINAFSLRERLIFQNRKVLPSMIEENRFK